MNENDSLTTQIQNLDKELYKKSVDKKDHERKLSCKIKEFDDLKARYANECEEKDRRIGKLQIEFKKIKDDCSETSLKNNYLENKHKTDLNK